MTPTNYEPATLAIFVRAEDVEGECKSCSGKGERWYLDDIKNQSKCRKCHGSGTRKITREGWVRVTDWDGPCPETIHRYMLYIPGISEGWGKSRDKAKQELYNHITKALHDGECPEPIRAQLKVVEQIQDSEAGGDAGTVQNRSATGHVGGQSTAPPADKEK